MNPRPETDSAAHSAPDSAAHREADPAGTGAAKPDLILGAGGFLGATLCDHLRRAGQPVRAFDRVLPPDLGRAPGARSGDDSRREPGSEPSREPRSEPSRGPNSGPSSDPGIQWHRGDFTDPASLRPALAGCGGVYHLISTTVPASSNRDPAADCQANILGTLRLLDLAREAGVRKIVFVSSGGTVYGIPRQIPIPETAPTDPICAYGISKLAIEKYLHLYHALHGLDYAVLRVSNPYGEHQRTQGEQGVVGVFAGKALRGEPIDIWGDGSVVRDYIYAGDVAEALTKAMAHTGPERVFNIGSGQGHSLTEILTLLECVLARPIARQHRPGRPVDVPSNVLDISQARCCLGWRPRTSFAQGLRRVIHHYQRA